jgi:hypothetical protein
MPEPLIENWPVMVLMVLCIIGIPFMVLTLLVSALKRRTEVPLSEHFDYMPIVAVTTIWNMMFICLLDIFVLQTLILTLYAAFFSLAITTFCSFRIGIIAKNKYGLIAYINNG